MEMRVFLGSYQFGQNIDCAVSVRLLTELQKMPGIFRCEVAGFSWLLQCHCGGKGDHGWNSLRFKCHTTYCLSWILQSFLLDKKFLVCSVVLVNFKSSKINCFARIFIVFAREQFHGHLHSAIPSTYLSLGS